MKRYLSILAIFTTILFALSPASAQIVPGYTVEPYATGLPLLVEISFDNNGTLYAGYDTDGPIYRIGPGGSPVTGYGPALYDADAVLVDNIGYFALPGSVLVGHQLLTGGGTVDAILPDQSLVNVITPTSAMENPNRIIFDNQGRLLIGCDGDVGKVFVSTGSGNVSELIALNETGASIAVDSQDHIYVSSTAGIVRKYDSNGALLDDGFVTGLAGISEMAFGPGNSLWGTDLYMINKTAGELLRINDLGLVSVIGTGFPTGTQGVVDLTFGNDGYMYLSLLTESQVIRIVPEPSALALLTLSTLALVRRR